MKRSRKHREIPIGIFFLKYFLYIFVGIVLAVVMFACTFWMLLTNDVVYPAGYAEEQAKAAVEEIQKAERVTEDLIPELCQYAVFDREGHVLSGNMGAKEVLRAWNVINGREYNGGTYIGADYYLGIPRGAECCVLRYQILVQYQSAILRGYLPQPEILLLIIFLVMTLGIILLVAVRFNTVVRKKLSPLADAADMIQRQELEFEISRDSVREINTILNAMDEMRIALKESLERQWRMEQTKNEQMSALAHDLKTPLTLVRGNAELLGDTCLTEEQNEYIDGIMDSALQMQEYVGTMIEVVRSSALSPMCRRYVDVKDFLEGIRKQVDGLCAIHRINMQWDSSGLMGEIYAEPVLLARAFMNIFANAVEHTPVGGTVLFEGRQDETYFVFSVSDSGKGFTGSALRHAKEQFYMDDDSRSTAGSHYGMGLYIVDMVVKQHEGILTLENISFSSDSEGVPPVSVSGCMHGGAKVTVKIPLV
ncbi:MAG: HAMP domain-containing histidine kinase [Lachnospiraceae bacterium]|nr:HAMP domain-containing histidine kinase [Lachnospiraceae bacterium]